jgi:hypothetical protein
MELAPSDQFDEIALQTLKCAAWTCRFVGIAIYTESRRGSLGSESMRHTGYTISSKDVGKELGRIATLIKRGDWEGLDIVIGKRFQMILCD